MRTSAPPLLPIFRSNLQGRVLALLYADPHAERSIADIVRRLGAPAPTVYREIDRLADTGVLETRQFGRERLVRPDMQTPFAEELAALVLKVFGPVQVLSNVLAPVAGIEEAFIYGSWAARFLGVAGQPARDLDVFIIGDPDPDELFEARGITQAQLGLETNFVVRSRDEWEAADTGFVRTVKRGSRVPIEIDKRDE
jgi:DNA-binding Lrp family transcriptional regulator